jgi:hypothetical protein
MTPEFLTTADLEHIDAAALSSSQKFLARIALSAWRSLLLIAETAQVPLEALTPQQVIAWLEDDARRRSQGQGILSWGPMPDLDFADPIEDAVTAAQLSGHEKFFARLLISALPRLRAIASQHDQAIASLTSSDILASLTDGQW